MNIDDLETKEYCNFEDDPSFLHCGDCGVRQILEENLGIEETTKKIECLICHLLDRQEVIKRQEDKRKMEDFLRTYHHRHTSGEDIECCGNCESFLSEFAVKCQPLTYKPKDSDKPINAKEIFIAPCELVVSLGLSITKTSSICVCDAYKKKQAEPTENQSGGED